MKSIILLLIVSLVFLGGCTSAPEGELVLGLQATPSSAVALVAVEKGFFEEEGLDIRLEEFTAGKFALQAFLAGSVDFAVAGDVPIVLASMQGNELYVLAQTVEWTTENPVLVIDEGISDPQEYFSLKKRKITTSIGGTPEFYTYNFLDYYGIGEEDVEIIAQKPEEMVAALTSGSVDGMSIFEPYPTMAEDLLPGKTLRMEIPPEIYSPRYVFVANKDWVDRNPEKAVAVLRALVKAEEFVQENPEEARTIVAQRTKFSQDLIDRIWSKFSMKVVITDDLKEVWDREAVWAVESGKLVGVDVPDFEEILREDLLEQARSN